MTSQNNEVIELLPPLWLRGALKDVGLKIVNSEPVLDRSGTSKYKIWVYRLHSVPTKNQLNNLRVRLTNRGFELSCNTGYDNYPTQLRCRGWSLSSSTNKLESEPNYSVDHIKNERRGRNQKAKVRRDDKSL